MIDDPATIVHVDMDAFYASVELLRHPELRGRPVVVGGDGRRGVVAAASYEARSYGVHSAMPSVTARRVCPDAVFLSGDHSHYAEVSDRIMALFRSVTPLVEPLSLDEAFLDVSGARRRLGTPLEVASTLRERILDEESLYCSVGVARTKFLAKLASEEAKPTPSRTGPIPGKGVVRVDPSEEERFLHPLDVSALWGVGKATRARLDRLGIRTVGDLAKFDARTLCGVLGDAAGNHLHDLANGRDERRVEPDRQVKSISAEQTYAHDLYDPGRIDVELARMSDSVATRLRNTGLFARTVTLKARFSDFATFTRSCTPAAPVSTANEITALARELYAAMPERSDGVRLLGVGGSGLVDESVEQLSFETLDGTGAPPGVEAAAADAIDAIRDRFGTSAIASAATLRDGRVDPKNPGDQQWGPGE